MQCKWATPSQREEKIPLPYIELHMQLMFADIDFYPTDPTKYTSSPEKTKLKDMVDHDQIFDNTLHLIWTLDCG